VFSPQGHRLNISHPYVLFHKDGQSFSLESCPQDPPGLIGRPPFPVGWHFSSPGPSRLSHTCLLICDPFLRAWKSQGSHAASSEIRGWSDSTGWPPGYNPSRRSKVVPTPIPGSSFLEGLGAFSTFPPGFPHVSASRERLCQRRNIALNSLPVIERHSGFA